MNPTDSNPDWSECYLIRYIAGDMGDFCGCLFDTALSIQNNTFDKAPTTNYTPWSKKWQHNNLSSTFIREQIMNNQATGQIVQNLASFKNNKVITLEDLSHAPKMYFENINLVYVFFPEEYVTIGLLFSIYKHKFHHMKSLIQNDKWDYDLFLKHFNKRKHIYKTDFPLNQISGYKNFKKFNVIKLLFENDNQGFSFIDINDVRIRNMINLGKSDFIEILDYFGLVLDDVTKYQNEIELKKFYDSIQERILL